MMTFAALSMVVFAVISLVAYYETVDITKRIRQIAGPQTGDPAINSEDQNDSS